MVLEQFRIQPFNLASTFAKGVSFGMQMDSRARAAAKNAGAALGQNSAWQPKNAPLISGAP